MGIKVKRDTGLMGGLVGVSLKVDDNRITTLVKSESFAIDTERELVRLRANQSFFGSQETKVKQGSEVLIRTNGVAVFLQFLSIFLVVLGGNIHLNFVYIGFLAVIITIIYSTKNWFKIEVDNQK